MHVHILWGRMYYIVGSGPAGISCAIALVRRGVDVTLLDAGVPPGPEILQFIERSNSQMLGESGASVTQDYKLIQQATTVKLTGVERKLSYGSDFPYRDVESKGNGISADGVSCVQSYAL